MVSTIEIGCRILPPEVVSALCEPIVPAPGIDGLGREDDRNRFTRRRSSPTSPRRASSRASIPCRRAHAPRDRPDLATAARHARASLSSTTFRIAATAHLRAGSLRHGELGFIPASLMGHAAGYAPPTPLRSALASACLNANAVSAAFDMCLLSHGSARACARTPESRRARQTGRRWVLQVRRTARTPARIPDASAAADRHNRFRIELVSGTSRTLAPFFTNRRTYALGSRAASRGRNSRLRSGTSRPRGGM